MKRTVLCAALLCALAAAAPFLCLLPVFSAGLPAAAERPGVSAPPAAGGGTPAVPATAAPTALPAPSATPRPEPDPIRLYDEAVGEVRTVPLEEYLVGAAACEMPPTWPDDALLAQMVAAHSYALYQRGLETTADGAYLTVNSALCSGWTTAEVLQSLWGEDFESRYTRFCTLAQRVLYDVLTYDSAPAAACYHAISTGHTEASQNVWVESLPYLQGVDSSWDKSAPDYEVTIQYGSQQVYDALAAGLGAAPEGAPADWVGKTVWDAAGYVQSIELGGHTFTGTQVRTALDLRSACFAIAWRDGKFVISTRGYGHGVGLSQYGACAMAEGGATWQNILAYYFPGTELQQWA